MAKQSVTLDVLSYHASASLDDAKRLQVCSIIFPFFFWKVSMIWHQYVLTFLSLQRQVVPSAQKFQLHDFKFDDINMTQDETLKVRNIERLVPCMADLFLQPIVCC